MTVVNYLSTLRWRLHRPHLEDPTVVTDQDLAVRVHRITVEYELSPEYQHAQGCSRQDW